MKILELIFGQAFYQLNECLADSLGIGGLDLVNFEIVCRNFDRHLQMTSVRRIL